MKGTPITAHMVKMGFHLLDEEIEEGPSIFLNYGDLKSRRRGALCGVPLSCRITSLTQNYIEGFGIDGLMPGGRRRRRHREGYPNLDGLLTAETRGGGGYVGFDDYDFGRYEEEHDYYAEDEEAWDDWDKMQQYFQRTRQPRGRVLHFIPSEQIKLLK
ncbi:hypothetical protein HDV00_001532, partial [Rhizophlyctis rosea]